MAKRSSKLPPAPAADPPSTLSAIASAFEGVRLEPAAESLNQIDVVPTIFPGLDMALTCGGVPLGKIIVVHGPTNHGKTVFSLGIIRSFLDLGMPALFLDAEHTLERDLVAQIMGAPLESLPHLMMPASKSGDKVMKCLRWYEDAIEYSARFMKGVESAREQDPRVRGGVIVVDSINKLVPSKRIKDVLGSMTDKQLQQSIEMTTRGDEGRDAARLNQAWLNHLTAEAAHYGVTVVIICQERLKGTTHNGFEIWEPKGGSALAFDATLRLRIKRTGYVSATSAKDSQVIASEHQIQVLKSKLGYIEGKHESATFWHANTNSPGGPGIDVYRDLLATCAAEGIVSVGGNYVEFPDGTKAGPGTTKQVAALVDRPELFADLIARFRAYEQETRASRRGSLIG